MKSKAGRLFEKRYFKLKEGYLYWYNHQRSAEAQNKIKISEIEEIKVEDESKPVFTLKMDSGIKGKKSSEYSLKAESVSMREAW